MSERYGTCKLCWGVGQIIQVTGAETPLEKSLVIECPRCSGDGFDGSSDNYDSETQ